MVAHREKYISTMEKSRSAERRKDIDGLRAVALGCVILYHAKLHEARGFFIGVDIFFVISGYFIALGLLRDFDKGVFSLGGFYLRRLWRIVPPLAAVVLLGFIPTYRWAPPLDFIQFGKTALAVLAFVSNYFFYFQGGYFDAPLESNPFLVTWFLSVVVQYYIVFPLFFRLFARRFSKNILALTTVLLLASLVYSEFLVRHQPSAAYFMLSSRLWELMLGTIVAILSHRGVLARLVLPFWMMECLGWAAVFVIALCGFTYSSDSAFPGLAALPICLGTAVLIALPCMAARRPSVNAVLSLRPVVVFGLVSYSVYLWHWPIITYLKNYLLVDTLSEGTKILFFLLTFLAGPVSWILLERGLGSVKSVSIRLRAIFLLAPIAIAALFLAILIGTDGLPNRFPPEAQPYITVLTEAQESAVAGAAIQINDITPQAIERVRRGDLHVFGDVNAPDPVFLAWGDSHIYHLGTLLGKIADEHSVKGLFLTTPGHPPLLDVYRSHWDATETRRKSYMDMTRAAVEMIREKRIPIVLLSCYWWFYPNQDLTALLDDGSTLTGMDALAQGLRTTIAALEEAGCEIWVLRPIPSYSFSVPQIMMRTMRSGRDPRPFYMSLADHNEKNADVQMILDEIGDSHPGVKFLDPVPSLCPEGVCLPEVDNQPLYFDNNHLSKFGALYIEPVFANFIAALGRHVR